MRTQLLLMTGAAALLAGCTADSNYQPAAGYSEAPVAYQTTYTVAQPTYQVQPSYQVTTYYTEPAPAYPFYSPQGSPPHTNDGGHTK